MRFFLILLTLGMLIFVGCNNIVDVSIGSDINGNDDINGHNMDDYFFMTKLLDVKTGDEYAINDFKGKIVLVESFAVWCPTCTKQQKILKEFHNTEAGIDVVSISLDTDPNENREIILSHINNNDFDWYYSISPINYTGDLIDEFGTKIVDAPSVPMILICKNQDRFFLKRGIKDIEDLTEEINTRCKK